MISIGIIGEYDSAHETHRATDDALGHAALGLGVGVDGEWVSTADITGADDVADFDGILVAPGTTYRDLDGALRAIEHARTADVPLLGTCGGFQHVVLELARNVLGLDNAQHAEYAPDAPTLVVTPLSCSLRGQTMEIEVQPDSGASKAYGSATATERYYCEFGLNPDHVADLVSAGVCISGTDAHGDVRIIELPHLRYFVGTLFVPQATSSPVRPHPLVTAFVAAARASQPEEPSGVTVLGEI